MQRVYDFLKNAKTYFIATTEGDQPRVRPFGTVDMFEGKLYFQTGKVKKVAQQLEKNPKVEICAMYGNEWIRVAAEAISDGRIEAKEHMLNAYPNLKAMYDAADDNTLVFYLKNATAVISSMGGEDVVIKF